MRPVKRASGVRVDPELLRSLAILAARREPLVLVTVVAASGSAPGKPGSKMIVTRAGLEGTVGGGKVEAAALLRARELLGSMAGPETQEYHVTQDLGMTCGGSMTLLFESMTAPPRLVIFGAGHVSQALCGMAVLAGFDVTVCDEREEWLTEDRFPDARERVLGPLAEAVSRVVIDATTFVACVTPGHASDEDVLLGVLSGGARPRYVGAIGSRRKAAILRKELMARGVSEADAASVRVPMGLDIGAVDPREIAVSVVAELVAVLRGSENPKPWGTQP
jgi:xanthine dehydrogenase accessory factor